MGKTKIGRNASCPCGSGRKFKMCCALKANKLNNIRKMDTDDIIKSLKTEGREKLTIRPDGTVLQGNHRIKVLEERGFETSKLYSAWAKKNIFNNFGLKGQIYSPESFSFFTIFHLFFVDSFLLSCYYPIVIVANIGY